MYNFLILMNKVKKDQSGQALALIAMMLMMFFAFICITINVGHFTAQRVTAQSAADANSMSGAVWMARALNTIQLINQVKQLGILHAKMEGYEVGMQLVHLGVAVAKACARCYVACIICVLLDSCVWEEAYHVYNSWTDLTDEIDDTNDELQELTDIQGHLNGPALYAVILAGSTLSTTENTPGSIIHLPIVKSMTKPMAVTTLHDEELIEIVPGAALVMRVLRRLFGLSFSSLTLSWDWAVLESEYHKNTYVLDLKTTSAKAPALWYELFGKPDMLISNLFMNVAHARPFKNETYDVRTGLSARKPSLASIFSLPPSFLRACKWDVKMSRVHIQYYNYPGLGTILGPISGVVGSIGISNLLIRH